jgi:hypothetical protein
VSECINKRDKFIYGDIYCYNQHSAGVFLGLILAGCTAFFRFLDWNPRRFRSVLDGIRGCICADMIKECCQRGLLQ